MGTCGHVEDCALAQPLSPPTHLPALGGPDCLLFVQNSHFLMNPGVRGGEHRSPVLGFDPPPASRGWGAAGGDAEGGPGPGLPRRLALGTGPADVPSLCPGRVLRLRFAFRSVRKKWLCLLSCFRKNNKAQCSVQPAGLGPRAPGAGVGGGLSEHPTPAARAAHRGPHGPPRPALRAQHPWAVTTVTLVHPGSGRGLREKRGDL